MNLVPIQSSSFDYLNIAIWQWQSGPDPDPWAENDPNRWTWQTYSDADCLILEQAFSLSKGAADLKGYEIDFKRMIQANKQFKDRIRRVRRLERSRFLIEIPPPVVVVREQKTMNEAFGTIQHFLDYIMKRTPKSYELYQRLKGLSLDCKGSEFQDVIQEVVFCIEKGAKFRQERIKGSVAENFLAESKRIIDLIRNNSMILRNFLQSILKVYTMETFVCYWLNELLRSENWEEMNLLTPYLVCLVYTFKFSGSIITHEKPHKFLKGLVGRVLNQKLRLYRGTALKKDHLELYDPQKVQYFSWNGVTSTSRNRNVALKFLQMSLATSKEPKTGVLFSIEANLEGAIDISKNSQYPNEQEIILAPGTVFKLHKACLIQNDIYEISLKVTKKFKKTEKEKVALLGTLQDETIFKNRAVIEGLPSPQSLKLIELLKGNKLIQKLEIYLSKIGEETMHEIEQMRLTTNVKKQDIKLAYNTIYVSSLSVLAHYFSTEQLTGICSNNEVYFQQGTTKNKVEGIKALNLGEDAFRRFNSCLTETWQMIRNESQITDLDLSLNAIISKDVTPDLVKCIKKLRYLKDLKLNFNENQMSSKESPESLCKTIGSLSGLNRVTLKFPLRDDESINFLEKPFLSLVTLQNLSLEFDLKGKTSAEGFKRLMNTLASLKSLQHLSVIFDPYDEISAEELSHLKNAFTSFTSLKYLSLNFKCYHNKTIPGESFVSLDFSDCKRPTDEGLKHLKDALKSLASLQYLSLNFHSCNKISDEGLKHLKNGLASLVSLQYLSLVFTCCDKISDEGLKHLKDAFTPLTSLRHLSLILSGGDKISDEGAKYVKDALTPLKSLQYLSLNLFESDEGVKYVKDAFTPLKSLQYLSLNLFGSDERLKHLKSGLTSLVSLQRLSIEFSWCHELSDQGLNHLKDGLMSLTSLQYLSLYFYWCIGISDKGLIHVKDSLLPLTSLQYLSLIFYRGEKISNKGLSHLKLGLSSLASLSELNLSFNDCKKVSFLTSDLENELTNISSITFNVSPPQIPELYDMS